MFSRASLHTPGGSSRSWLKIFPGRRLACRLGDSCLWTESIPQPACIGCQGRASHGSPAFFLRWHCPMMALPACCGSSGSSLTSSDTAGPASAIWPAVNGRPGPGLSAEPHGDIFFLMMWDQFSVMTQVWRLSSWRRLCSSLPPCCAWHRPGRALLESFRRKSNGSGETPNLSDTAHLRHDSRCSLLRVGASLGIRPGTALGGRSRATICSFYYPHNGASISRRRLHQFVADQ